MDKKSEKQNVIFMSAAAFGLTALLLCIVYAGFGLFPFGEKTLAWGDMKQQVIPLMLELKDILAGNSGFLLNFQNAGGMSFWGVFFFFLSSPFTFLTAFVEKGDVYFLVNLLVLAKLALSSATASLFFQEEQPDLNAGFHLFFCVSYGLCGYGLLYYQNIVWLDMLYLFPILMLGFLRLIYSGKSFLFTTSLAAAIIINYYLSYMVLLALILISALFVKNCVPKEKRGETSGKIGVSALLSLLLTAVVWIPSLLQCLRSARTSQGIIGSIQAGGILTEVSTTLPVLLCTAGAVVFPAAAALFPKSPKRKTLLQLFLLTSLPLVLEPINKLWHTGSYQAFPARYGYIPQFLALWCMADFLGGTKNSSRSVRRKRRSRLLLGLTVLALFICGSLIMALKFDSIVSYTQTLWFDDESFLFLLLFSLLAAAFMWLGLFLWHRGNLSQKALSSALLAICLIQGVFHAAILIGSAANVPDRETTVLKTEGSIPDDGFYRVKQDFKFCDVNLLGASGFCSINHYTSLTDEKFLYAVKKLGYSSYWMETSACCGTVLSDILLSNKYSLLKNLRWEKTGSGNIGYVLPAGTLPETLSGSDRASLQNVLFRRISGLSSDAFRVYAPTEVRGIELKKEAGETQLRRISDFSVIRYTIPTTSKESLYFDAFNENTTRLQEPINNTFKVVVNGRVVSNCYPNQSCNGFLKLGEFEDETVSVEIWANKGADCLKSFGVFGIRSEDAESFAKSLKSTDLHAEKSRVFGTANAEESGQALFLSIPYSPGMRIVVNQKTVEPKIVLDCFLEIPLEQGTNEIELTLIPQGVKAGGFLSIATVVICLTAIFLRCRKKGRAEALWNKAAYPLLNAAFYSVLLLIYLAPIALWFGKFL